MIKKSDFKFYHLSELQILLTTDLQSYDGRYHQKISDGMLMNRGFLVKVVAQDQDVELRNPWCVVVQFLGQEEVEGP